MVELDQTRVLGKVDPSAESHKTKTPAERKAARLKKGSKPPKAQKSEEPETKPTKVLDTIFYGGNQMESLNEACDANPQDEPGFLASFAEDNLHPTIESENGPRPDGKVPIITFPRTSGDVHVDLNPPLYPWREDREDWTQQTYEDYLSKVPDFQKESVDEIVLVSKSIFFDDYFGVLQRNST